MTSHLHPRHPHHSRSIRVLRPFAPCASMRRSTSSFLVLLLTLLSLSFTPTASSAAATARLRPDYGLIYNDDADLSFLVPDRAQSEALLRANLAALADTPVRTLVYCVGMGGDLLYYNTTVASRVGWRQAADEKPGSLMAKRMENARVCLAAGADAVRTAGETARALGLRFIPSLRMNDAHFMTDPDGHSMTSEFWLKHRHEFPIKDSPLPFQPAYGNLLDYTHAAVRQHRLDTVFEVLARNRELVDGFELDFNRFQVFFPKGRAAAGAPLMTELVRRVRARLDELAAAERRPMSLFVRVPPSLADCTFAGLDVATWISEGLVDLVSPAQIMTLAGDMPIADLVALARTHGVRLHPSLYPRTSWRVPFPARGRDRYSGAAISRAANLDEIRGAAAAYRQLGVDGFYLFNFYNAFGSARPHEFPLYQVFRDLARPENLRGQPVTFAVTKSYYHDGPGSYAYGKQLPARLSADTPLRLTLPVALPDATSPFPLRACELRLGLRGVPDTTLLRLIVNGRELHSAPLATGTLVKVAGLVRSVPKRPDLADVYLHLPLTPADLRAGENLVTVTLSAPLPAAAEVSDLELRLEPLNQLETLWHRTAPPLNSP
ncbi:MAG: hypothetical protein RLZZ188_422 [Verrucomicrobiota bacterium]